MFEELDKIKTLSVGDSELEMILDKDKGSLGGGFCGRSEYDEIDIADGRYARHYKGFSGGYCLTVVDLVNKEEVRDEKGAAAGVNYPISVVFVTLDHGEWVISRGVSDISALGDIVSLGRESGEWLETEGYRQERKSA